MPGMTPKETEHKVQEIKRISQLLGHGGGGQVIEGKLASIGAGLRALDPASVLQAVHVLQDRMWCYWPVEAAQKIPLVLSGMDSPKTAWVGECLLSLDGNGYARQERVTTMGARITRPQDQAEPDDVVRVIVGFLVRRLNDWVPQVADEARRVFLGFLQGASIELLISCMPYAEIMRSLTRVDHREVLDAWLGRLMTPGGEAALWKAFEEGNQVRRRLVAETLVDLESADWGRWVSGFITSRDDVVVLCGVDLALRFLEGPELRRALERAIEHPAPRVRTRVLRTLATQFAGEPFTVEQLERALWDRTRTARRIAQFYLGKERGQPEIALGYSADLEAPAKRQKLAILGLSETGSRDDAPQLLAVFRSTRGRNAARALEGYCRLTKESVVSQANLDLLQECVRSQDPSVRSVAIRLIAPEIVRSDEPWITEALALALTPPREASHLMQLLRLAPRLRWDDRLRLTLATCPPADASTAERISQQLNRLTCDLNRAARTPTAPSEANLSVIRTGLIQLRTSHGAGDPHPISLDVIKALEWLTGSTQPDSFTPLSERTE